MISFLNPTYIISILIALSVHEWAHAFIAHRLGDPTAENEGRLTLNPISHLDPLGALMFLFVGFGWAKPVPVNPTFFRHPKRDMALVALAGPFSNLVIALIAYAGMMLLNGTFHVSVLALLPTSGGDATITNLLSQILRSSIWVNLGLMAFNLLPLSPLDGSNILRMFIPYRYEDRFEEIMRYGPYILLGLILFGNVLHLPLLSVWVNQITLLVLWVLQVLTGFIPLP